MSRKITKSKWKKEDIVNAIVKMRTEQMATTKTILDFLMTDIGYGQAYSYELIKESRAKIVELYDNDNLARVQEAIGQLETMLERSYQRGDYKLSDQIRQEISKLTGLYAAQKVDITSLGEAITEIKLIQVNKKEDLDE